MTTALRYVYSISVPGHSRPLIGGPWHQTYRRLFWRQVCCVMYRQLRTSLDASTRGTLKCSLHTFMRTSLRVTKCNHRQTSLESVETICRKHSLQTPWCSTVSWTSCGYVQTSFKVSSCATFGCNFTTSFETSLNETFLRDFWTSLKTSTWANLSSTYRRLSGHQSQNVTSNYFCLFFYIYLTNINRGVSQLSHADQHG